MDELFVLNCAIDYFLLLATAKVRALPLRRWRFAIAGVFGGLWCCLALLPELIWLGSSVMKTVLGMAMCLIAFGRDGKLWRSFGVFWGLSLLFGGAVWAAGLRRGLDPHGTLVKLDMRVLLLSFAVCWVGVSLVFRHSAAKAERTVHDITVFRKGQCVYLRALRDTGNELYDPLTGRRILIAQADALHALFEPQERLALHGSFEQLSSLRGFHLIPYASLGGSGLLPCFRPDRVTVDGEARDDLAVAVCEQTLDANGQYHALL